MSNGKGPVFSDPDRVADAWERWCGETPWSRHLRQFGRLGGKIKWWCGYPRSASAIPLCFELQLPDNEPFPSHSRLKDIRSAVEVLKARREFPGSTREVFENFLKAQNEYYKENNNAT